MECLFRIRWRARKLLGPQGKNRLVSIQNDLALAISFASSHGLSRHVMPDRCHSKMWLPWLGQHSLAAVPVDVESIKLQSEWSYSAPMAYGPVKSAHLAAKSTVVAAASEQLGMGPVAIVRAAVEPVRPTSAALLAGWNRWHAESIQPKSVPAE